jgi:hypothetical protein
MIVMTSLSDVMISNLRTPNAHVLVAADARN